MKQITGSFRDLIGRNDDAERERMATLKLELNQNATALDGTAVERIIEIPLIDGAIPEGTTVWGNDELAVPGTRYKARVYVKSIHKTGVYLDRGCCFNENLIIEGEGPIYLRAVMPIGPYPGATLKEIRGVFTRGSGKPAADATLTLTLEPDAETVIATGEAIDAKGYEPRTVKLDAKGQIPPGFRVLANDDVNPPGTMYEISVAGPELEARNCGLVTHFRGNVSLVGDDQIDLNMLHPDLAIEPEPLPPPPPPPAPPRKAGINYNGFFGGVIHCPSTNGEPMEIGAGGVFPFTLPYRAAVHVAIFIDEPHLGNNVIVELLSETSGKKVCSVVIDASREGVAIGKFPGATLNSGDYLLTWRTAFLSRTLKVRSAVPVYAAQLALARGMQPILAHFG